MSHDGRYLVIVMYEELRKNLLFVADLEKNGDIVGKIPLIPIIDTFDADYEVS